MSRMRTRAKNSVPVAVTVPGRKQAEFSEKVKQTLAAEAGYVCANPSCCAPTFAAGSTAQQIGKVGEAAHISAAAEGFARWLPGMDSDVRKSAANGIWLCNTHAREIDVDEHRYTIRLLHSWKRRARIRALAARGRPKSWAPTRRQELIRASRALRLPVPDPDIGEFVDGFMDDVGGDAFWVQERLECLRLALYEVALNAMQHGGATMLHIRSRGYRIDLVHDGANFNPTALIGRAGDGGTAALEYLVELFGNDLTLRHKYNGDVVTLQVIDVSVAGPEHPCAVNLSPSWVHDNRGTIDSCTVIHLFPQKPMRFSDGKHLAISVSGAPQDKVYVLHDTNPKVIEHLRKSMPILRAPGEVG